MSYWHDIPWGDVDTLPSASPLSEHHETSWSLKYVLSMFSETLKHNHSLSGTSRQSEMCAPYQMTTEGLF